MWAYMFLTETLSVHKPRELSQVHTDDDPASGKKAVREFQE